VKFGNTDKNAYLCSVHNEKHDTMTGTSIKRQELRWQAEEDARTMARYQEILGDSQRMSRAVKVARQQASDLNKRAAAMNKVAGTRAKTKK